MYGQRKQLSPSGARRLFSATSKAPVTRQSFSVQYVMRGGIRF